MLDVVEPTPVVPCRGALGLWTVPDGVERMLVRGVTTSRSIERW